MKSSKKKWIIAALIMIAIGIICIAAITVAVDMDYTKLNNEPFETKTIDINDSFSNIKVCMSNADIKLVLSDSKKCTVECYEQKSLSHCASVENNTLIINEDNNRKWYDNVEFSYSSPTVTVYLPQNEYNSLIIEEYSGDVSVPEGLHFISADVSTFSGEIVFCSSSENVKIGTYSGYIQILDAAYDTAIISTESGNAELKSVKITDEFTFSSDSGDFSANDLPCKKFSIETFSGYLNLKNVTASETMSLISQSGDMKLKDCDAEDITIKTETGNVNGTLLSGKTFTKETSSGDIITPANSGKGKCRLSTVNGYIIIKVK